MIEQIAAFFTIEMIYLWLNIGVLPFWLVLIFFPQSKVCSLLVTSIFPFLILGATYCYLIFYYFSTGYNFVENFNLYKGLFDFNPGSSFSDLFYWASWFNFVLDNKNLLCKENRSY